VLGWLSDASACASHVNRARRSWSLAKACGQELQSDIAIELRIASARHLVHAAFADLRLLLSRYQRFRRDVGRCLDPLAVDPDHKRSNRSPVPCAFDAETDIRPG